MEKTLVGRTNQMKTCCRNFIAKGHTTYQHITNSGKARSIAETLTMENICELLPPSLKVKITRLYVLLSKTNIVMDIKLLEKLEYIMVFLMKLETIGTLSNMFVSVFGQWYLYPLVSILQLFYVF